MTQLKSLKFVATLVLVFRKIESEDKTKYDNFCLSSLWKGSGWIIDSVIDQTISISKYNPLAGISYTKLPKELEHPKKKID